MKRMDLFCASPASTAICSSMDQRSMVRHGTRPLNHHHHHLLHDQRRKTRASAPVPCSLSQLPFSPRPYPQKSHSSKSTSSSSNKEIISDMMRRKSSADIITDLSSSTSPPGSSRYLLSDKPFIDFLSSDSDRGLALVPTTQVARTRQLIIKSSHDHDSPMLNSSLSTRSRDQVVVLRVSLHCKGCEGKVRKHILRMEGVRSFSIDFANKKVTIIGDVTPLGVLASVSKVKNAQLWPTPSSSSSSSSSPSVSLVNYTY